MALLALMLYASEAVLHLRSRMIAGGKSFFRVRGAICFFITFRPGKILFSSVSESARQAREREREREREGGRERERERVFVFDCQSQI